MEEIWKDINGYEGLYQVSSLGRVKSVERAVDMGRSDGRSYTLKERILRPVKHTDGYLHVDLCKNGVIKHNFIHRLVATVFIPNDDIFATTVNHKNEVKTDNRAENLEWMSSGDNTRYSTLGSKNWKARPVRCVETNQVFGCARDASRWLGLSITAVGVATRREGTAGGYHFEYVNKQDD